MRVLEREVRGRGGALQVQAPHDDVEHRGHRRQLHAVEHGRQLRGDGVHVGVVGVHGGSGNHNQNDAIRRIWERNSVK